MKYVRNSFIQTCYENPTWSEGEHVFQRTPPKNSSHHYPAIGIPFL